jgi:predicted transcriptional regulator
MNWNNSALKILGLTNTETIVLMSLNTELSVQNLSKVTKLSRTGINHILDKLIKKKLVVCYIRGRRRFYKTNSNRQIIDILQQSIDSLEMNLENKQGIRIKLSEQDEFIIHLGSKEIVPAFKRISSEMKNERVKAIQHHKSFIDQLEKATPEQIIDFNKGIINNSIIVDGLVNEGAYYSYEDEIKKDPQKFKRQIEGLEGRSSDYSVFPDNNFNCSSEIWIFRTTTLIISWKDGVAIEIINQNMTALLQEMFEYVKKSSRKIDHNKVMRELITNYIPK